MTLSRKIVDAVDALPPVTSGGLVEAEAGPSRIALGVTERGPVGLAFVELHYARSNAGELSTEALRAWGNRLAARLTYLMEPLVVLEVDAQAGEAELRSQSPTPRGDRRSFYEVRLRSEGTLLLRRIAFDQATQSRQVVSCQMTREVLERLVDDLADSVA